VPAGPHKWRDLMEPVTRAREELRLNTTDLSVLRAVLSFIPNDLLSLDRPEGHICFAGNLAIADRIGSSGDSTVNRSLRRLEQAGLVERRQSANRKRYAHRSRAGVILRAYGIDLAPLVARQGELTLLAREADEARGRLEDLREDCKALVLDLRRGAEGDLCEETRSALAELLDGAQRLLRRKPAAEPLLVLRDRLGVAQDALGSAPSPQRAVAEPSHAIDDATTISSNSLDRNERHIDSEHEFSDLRPEPRISFAEIHEAFPTLMSYIEEKDDLDEIQNTSDVLARSMGDTDVPWRECKRQLGFATAVIFLGFMLESRVPIENPGGYLRTLTREAREGRLYPRSLVSSRRNTIPSVPKPSDRRENSPRYLESV
jgi:replication initiation protein RepC